MKKILIVAAAAGLMTLAACGGTPNTSVANDTNIEASSDNLTDLTENETNATVEETNTTNAL